MCIFKWENIAVQQGKAMVRFWFKPVPIFGNRNRTKPVDPWTITEPNRFGTLTIQSKRIYNYRYIFELQNCNWSWNTTWYLTNFKITTKNWTDLLFVNKYLSWAHKFNNYLRISCMGSSIIMAVTDRSLGSFPFNSSKFSDKKIQTPFQTMMPVLQTLHQLLFLRLEIIFDSFFNNIKSFEAGLTRTVLAWKNNWISSEFDYSWMKS